MEIYTVAEAAKILRVGRNTVYGLIKTGELQVLKLGGLKSPDWELERFVRERMEQQYEKSKKDQTLVPR